MSHHLNKIIKLLFWVLFPLGVCVVLWMKSDPPPFGTSLNELSDHSWGIYVDIARQWKSGDFSYWTRSIGGGFCLYTSGFYPIWVPWNVVAKVISFDHFYLFKMIEPYFIGLLSMMLLLRHGLRMSYPLAAFGALAYNGCVFTRHVGILHMPFFLWACAFFPLILYVYARLFNKSFYLRSAVLGALMALIFLGGGAGQYAQMIIWGLILLMMDAGIFLKQKSFVAKIFLACAGCVIFVFFAFTIVGGQILPMAAYTLTESSRTLGEYPINNFPFFRNDYKGAMSISKIFSISMWTNSDQGVRAFWALFIFAVGKLIVDWKAFRLWFSTQKAWANILLTTVLFFLLPPFAEILSHAFPFFAKLFNPLRMFTFGYCGFMIDMVIVVGMVSILNLKTFSDHQTPIEKVRKQNILLAFLLTAVIYMFFPLWISQLFPDWNKNPTSIHLVQRYLMVLGLLIFVFPVLRFKALQKIVLTGVLLFVGGRLLQTSYAWGEKGQQTARASYSLDTPEHQYYQRMKGHYYLPFVSPDGKRQQHVSMTHNYSLLYDVDSLQGFLNTPPKRLSNFINAFQNDIYWTKNTPAYKFGWRATPASLTTHFPIDFTTIKKGAVLAWPDFKKVIDGESFDVWVREKPLAPVRFAKDIRIVSYRELIDSFNRPYDGVIGMTSEDAKRFDPPSLTVVPNLQQAVYRQFERKKPDEITFDVETKDEIIVVLPEMYQAGWRLKVNGRSQTLFPASSIFIGFLLEKGHHHIELKFRPILWEAGWFLSFVGSVLFIGMIDVHMRTRRKHL